MRNIVVDTGPLVALFSRRDRDHRRVVGFLSGNPCMLLTTWPVVTEAWHLLSPAARVDLMRWIVAGGAAVFDLGPEAGARMLGLVEKYRDRPMDLADASLVLLAEHAGVHEILTIDRANFDVYRLAKGRRFTQVL